MLFFRVRSFLQDSFFSLFAWQSELVRVLQEDLDDALEQLEAEQRLREDAEAAAQRAQEENDFLKSRTDEKVPFFLCFVQEWNRPSQS